MEDVPSDRKKSLDAKYWSLFWTYTCATPQIDDFLRNKILQAHREKAKLRGDAAYFLLLNFDQMIFRVELISSSAEAPPAYPTVPSLDQIEKGFWRIIEGLHKQQPDEYGHSAHQVIRSIDGAWAEILDFFLWE